MAGRYQVLTLISEGGMGRVYEAEQRIGAAARRIALKTMRPEWSGDASVSARFSRECALLMGLEHPNTVKIFDFGTTDEGELYLAMELVRGETLTATLAREGALAPERVEAIVAQIAGSLDEAHQKGIVHRDLKPDNILLSRHAGVGDFVKVLDFGVAKQVLAPAELAGGGATKHGVVLGSPAYMSPEQLLGTPVDSRADVYALGLLAYEMFTGRRPFAAETTLEWASQHLNGSPAPLEATAAGAALPEHVKRALLGALAKAPAHRPAGVLAFYRQLLAEPRRPSLGSAVRGVADTAAWAPAEPGSAQDDARPVAPPPRTQRPRMATVVAVAVGAVASAALLTAGMLLHHAFEEGSHAPLRGHAGCAAWTEAARDGSCEAARALGARCPADHADHAAAAREFAAHCGDAGAVSRPR